MKQKYLFETNAFLLFILGLFTLESASAQELLTEKMFRNSYHVWELQRNAVGVYRDSKLFSGTDYHPCSVANVGIGLVSLCIADSMKWDINAREKALKTLKSMTGHTLYFKPERNESGFFRHFIDMNTGARYWDSEFSTIDSEILVAGALFAKNYFKNDSISKYALELWNSIQHEKAIADAANGKIYLTMQTNGFGTSGSVTSVYNEYMIVAWMAKNATTDINSPAHILWNKFYADPSKLPYTMYGTNRVLTDQSGSFLSSFTHLFNYYLCHYFTTSQAYTDLLKQAQLADVQWWDSKTSSTEWEWGCGAGTGPEGYHADKINDNQNQTISPQIIAGFLPVNPDGERQLIEIWQNKKGNYVFPQYPNDTILWRFSLKNTAWKAPEVQGIDYSTFLFGLASLPQFLGKDFFEKNNNFFADSPTKNNPDITFSKLNIIFKNQTNGILTFSLNNPIEVPAKIEVLNLYSQTIYNQVLENRNVGQDYSISVSGLAQGIYFLRIETHGKQLAVKKFIKSGGF